MENKLLNAIHEYNIEQAYIMMYFTDKVVLGKYKNQTLFIPQDYNPELCVEIHIFNKELELRCGTMDESFVAIYDSEDYLEEDIYIIGSEGIKKDGYTISRQYGREVILPFEINITGKQELKIKVRNLFSNEDAQLEGYRLVDIVGGDIYE